VQIYRENNDENKNNVVVQSQYVVFILKKFKKEAQKNLDAKIEIQNNSKYI
jgi:hypothetical protein